MKEKASMVFSIKFFVFFQMVPFLNLPLLFLWRFDAGFKVEVWRHLCIWVQSPNNQNLQKGGGEKVIYFQTHFRGQAK